MFRNRMFRLFGGFLAVCLLCAMPAYGQGLIYVDAFDDYDGSGFGPNANIGPPSAFNQLAAEQDNLWGFREDFGAEAPDGTRFIWESGGTDEVSGVEDSPEITQTISGLTPGNMYDVYAAYWSPTGQNWTIRTGTSSGNLTLYDLNGATHDINGTMEVATAGIHASRAIWSEPPTVTNPDTGISEPIFTEADRVMLLGLAGTVTADSSGEAAVFIDDRPNSGFADRSWFDGVAFVEAGTVVAVTTPGDFNGDGVVDLDDLNIFRTNLHTDVSALTPAEASFLGDMNGDLVINHADFVAFRNAFNAANGAGALQAALAVPEPSAALILLIGMAPLVTARYRAQLRHQLRCTSRLVPRESSPQLTTFQSPGPMQTVRLSWIAPIATVAFFSLISATRADLVSGWGLETGQQFGTLTEGEPGSFEISNVTANAVPRALLPGPGFDLSNVGDTVRLRGFATFENALGNIQFRWGLYDTNGANTGTLSNGLWSGATIEGWKGYFASPGDDFEEGADAIFALNGAAYFSVFGGNESIASFPSTSNPPANVEYQFSLTLRRLSATDIQANFTFVGGDENRSGSGIDTEFSTSLSTLNAVGFLTNGTTGPGSFRDVVVEVPKLLGLRVNPTTGDISIVNNTDVSLDMNYYEIHSDSGSLDLSGWNSFANQDGNVLAADAWQEAGGSSENLLSEFIIDGTKSLAPSASATLGNAFNVGGAEDLTFLYGLPDGTLETGFVEFVSVGIPGDFNGDGDVDGQDFLEWQRNPSIGNLTDWEANFGTTSLAAATVAVPEPATWMSLLLAATVGLTVRRRKA